MRVALLLTVLAMLLGGAARADMRSDAVRLLAHRVRAEGDDPKDLAVSGVVVRGNQALLSWDSGKRHGVMGLVTSADRWWDALDMSRSLSPPGCWQSDLAYPLAPALPWPLPYTPPVSLPPPNSQTLASYGLSKELVAGAAAANSDVRTADAQTVRAACDAEVYETKPDARIHPAGGTIHPPIRQFTGGYDVTISYGRNNAAADAKLSQLFARAPTQAEFAPNHAPAPGWGGPDAVCFFDIGISAAKPVTFERGTTIDIWFPFVLDDQLRYNLSFFSAGKPSGMIFATVFDNTLHFVLPPFTIDPHDALMGEIDGDPKGPS